MDQQAKLMFKKLNTFRINMSSIHHWDSSFHSSTSSVRWNRHSPLQFRRNYLADRFLTKTMSHNFAPLIKSIKFILSHWRFVPAKLPLLCKKVKTFLKLQKFTYQLSQYHFAILQFSSSFHKTPFHKLPKPNEPNCQYLFTYFIQQHFPQEKLIFTDGSKSHLGVGAGIWIPRLSFFFIDTMRFCSKSVSNFKL